MTHSVLVWRSHCSGKWWPVQGVTVPSCCPYLVHVHVLLDNQMCMGVFISMSLYWDLLKMLHYWLTGFVLLISSYFKIILFS